MYKKITLIIFIMTCNLLGAQDVLTKDAFILNKNLAGNIFNYKSDLILAHYFGIDKKFIVSREYFVDSINKLLKLNPFLSSFQLDAAGPNSEKIKAGLSGMIGNMPGLDVTSIVDGFSKFIVKRTKEELNIAFFERFKKDLQDPKYKDLQTVFPQTWHALSIIGEDIYDYEKYLRSLRENFEYDLRVIDDKLPMIIENHLGFFDRHPELTAFLRSGIYIYGGLRDKVHPGTVLDQYPLEYLDSLSQDMKGSIRLLQLVSYSMRDSSDYWVNSKTLRTLLKDPTSLRLFFGLIYQVTKTNAKYQNIQFNKISLDDMLKDLASNWNTRYMHCHNYIIGFSERAERLNILIKNYQKQKTDSLAIEQYVYYFNTTIDLLEYASAVGTMLPEAWTKNDPRYAVFPVLQTTMADYFSVIRSTSQLTLDIKRKNYSGAILQVSNIYNLLYAKHHESELKEIKQNWVTKVEYRKAKKKYVKSAVPADKIEYQKKITRHESQKTRKINARNAVTTSHKLFKYGAFMAAVAQAKSSDEISVAIESVALPSGSSRTKRVSRVNVSLNAYCGLFAGCESVKFRKNLSPAYGLTVPVGIALSWGLKTKGSFSIFASIVDIGAVTSFRFRNETFETLDKIQLKDIISPGVFLSYGIPKCPISINLGSQMTPLLSSVTATGNTLMPKNLRFSLSICVDIPLLNFYTQTEY